MDIFSLGIGIAVGAAFSPFWIGLWRRVKPTLASWFSSTKDRK